MQYNLKTPVTREDLAPLKAGDTVLLSGTVYTARDAAHKRMMERLDAGEPLPFPVEGSAVYYVGPTPERPGEVIGSAGPTTSGRMDAYSPRLLDLGLKLMIGKGKRNQAVKDAVVRNGAVYLAALGGAGALMAASVKELEVLCWEDLGCEAVRRLEVDGLFVAVGQIPQNQPFAHLAETDAQGYLKAGEDCRTSRPGLFAAGDGRTKTVRQLVTAAADGAVAALGAAEYLRSR